MTEDEREELIEKIARHLAIREDITPDLTSEILTHSSWCNENWHCWIPEARAALAVAEPVIREQANDALREENERLRDALQPFVDRLEVLEETIAHKYAIATNIDVEHLRAARAALQDGEKDG
jgi:hypothetical protein